MAREIPAAAQTKIDQALGTEPILIIKIEWPSDTQYYADKDLTIGAITADGRILSASELQMIEKSDSLGEVAGMNITLDDSDGAIKSKVDKVVIEGTACTVYHHFEGNTDTDLIILLKGRISGDMLWDEGKRTFDFKVESFIVDDEIGYAPEEDAFANMNNEVVGVPWPMCFGTVVHVPAVRIKRQPRGTLKEGINQNYDSFRVDGWETFPQSTSITIEIDRVRYTGSFTGAIFTVSQRNINHIAIGNLFLKGRPLSDPHAGDPSVCWINNPLSNRNIVGLYCYIDSITHGPMINKCIKQAGEKCWFTDPWVSYEQGQPQEILVDTSTGEIDEAAGVPRSSWDYDVEIGQWPASYYNSEVVSAELDTTHVLRGRWALQTQEKVRMIADWDDVYIANLYGGYILDVYGHRQYKGERIFAPIPSSYYTVTNFNGTYLNAMTLTFDDMPLEAREGEDWEGDVYVSLNSYLSGNIASIINYLLTQHSSITPESDSFNQAAIDVSPYVSNFAYFNRPNVIGFCESIAWQARCALLIRNGEAYLTYLSQERTEALLLNNSNVEMKSIGLSFTPTVDTVTRLIAKYKFDYAGREGSDHQLIYRNNIDIFGLREEEKDFFIYTCGLLVKMSAYFWGYRLSNSWRKIVASCFLEGLPLETFDIVKLYLPVVSTNYLYGQVEESRHNPSNQSVQLQLELASKAGNVDGADQPVVDEDYWTGDPSYPVEPITVPNLGEGRYPIDYVVPDDIDDGEGGEEGDGEIGDTVVPAYVLVFTVEPSLVERGENFALRVEIHDAEGNLVPEDASAALTLESTDGADVLNTLDISIVAGIWESTTMQITTGAGHDTGSITVSSPDYVAGLTGAFDIIPVFADLTLETSPPNVTREVAQALIKLASGAVVGEKVNIGVYNSDPADKLYDSGGTEIVELTADGAGEFWLAANWTIKGGNGTFAAARFLLTDTEQLKYNDLKTVVFTVQGVTVKVVQQTLLLDDIAIAQPGSLVLEVADYLEHLLPFPLEIEILDSDGARDTSWSGNVSIELRDDTGAIADLYWTAAGPNATIVGTSIIAQVTNGYWYYAACIINIPDAAVSPMHFLGLTDPDELEYDLSKEIGRPYFVVAVPVGNISRGVNFSLTVQAFNSDGTPDTTYSPSVDPDIVLVEKTDGADVFTPVKMGLAGWASGQKTIATAQINGGADSDTTKVNVTEVGVDGRTGTSEIIAIDIVKTIINPTTGYRFSGSHGPIAIPGSEPDRQNAFNNTQQTGYANLLADVSLAAGIHLSDIRDYTTGGAGWFNFGGNAHLLKFTVTPAQRANLKTVFMVGQFYATEFYAFHGHWHAHASLARVDIGGEISLPTSGAHIINHIGGIKSMTFAYINELCIADGGTPAAPGTFKISLPVNLFDKMGPTDTIFYLWFGIKKLANLPYVYPYDSVGFSSKYHIDVDSLELNQ